MLKDTTDTIWVGMDVHQDSITAAILFGQDNHPQIERLPGDLDAVRRMFRRLSLRGTPRSCYEASAAGYVLQRCLEHDSFHCEVIGPRLIPRKPGDRRKTDRLDAVRLVYHYPPATWCRWPYRLARRKRSASWCTHGWWSSRMLSG